MPKKVLRDVEIWWPKLVKSESFRGGREAWSVQLRTTDSEKADEMEERGFTVKQIRPNKKKGEDFEPYFRANIKRPVYKNDGSERDRAKVLDAGMDDVDPRTIGNGSVANIQYFPWEMEINGEEVSGRVLEKVQVTKLIVYEGSGDGEDEELDLLDGETEIVDETSKDEEDEELY